MFNKRKSNKQSKSRNVNFELPQTTEENNECVPGFYFGSSGSMSQLYKNPLPWESAPNVKSSHEEMDKIIAPSDRFESLITDDYTERTPEIFVSVDMHHYDEEDYHNHRHRMYPHMHQPLKSMEPRVLRKIKEKIRDNKTQQQKAATAGVPTSVPQLLASSSSDNSRVIIDSSNDDNRVVSGPVLSIISPTPIDAEVKSTELDQVVTSTNPGYFADETLGGPSTTKKRKKRKKRIKKQEPFQPTLGKLSEESSSPNLSGPELALELDDDEEDEDDDDNMTESGGLVLENLSSVVSTDSKSIENSDSKSGHTKQLTPGSGNGSSDNSDANIATITSSTSSEKNSDNNPKQLSFLEEIASADDEQPIGFLDITFKSNYTRKHSLPMFLESPSRLLVGNPLNKINQSNYSQPVPPTRTYSTVTPPVVSDLLDPITPSINDKTGNNNETVDDLLILPRVQDNVDGEHHHSFDQLIDISDNRAINDTNKVSSTPAIVPGGLEKQLSLTEPNVATESHLPCNFHIGSTDSVINTVDQHIEPLTKPEVHEDTKPHHHYHHHKKSPRHHHHHHHHHHHKEHYTKRDLEKRTFSGQDMRSLWLSNDVEECLDEYQSMLGDAIIDDMKSHRYYNMPALNRSRIRNKYLHSNSEKIQRSKSVTQTNDSQNKLKHDYNPSSNPRDMCSAKCGDDLIFQSNVSHKDSTHRYDNLEDNVCPLFVEMDILRPHKYWREVSRWVRYEQVYNEFSDTFGKAHSSPLKFTAFTQFRVQIENALFLPNVEVNNFAEAISLLTEELLVAQLFTEPREAYFVKEIFSWKHVHAGEKVSQDTLGLVTTDADPHKDHVDSGVNKFSTTATPRLHNTTPSNLNNSYKPVLSSTSSVVKTNSGTNVNIGIPGTSSTLLSSAPQHTTQNKSNNVEIGSNAPTSAPGATTNTSGGSVPFMLKVLKNTIPLKLSGHHHHGDHHGTPHHHKSDLEGHLPENIEGAAVQVGEMVTLKKPFFAILRFKRPLANLDHRLTEVSVPIRFMIVCLGPPGLLQYEEVGRVISTMMINKEFRKTMYRATDKCEIIESLYKYLDTCFVLSYSDSHPARNMHTMVDHIHEFMRQQQAGSVLQQQYLSASVGASLSSLGALNSATQINSALNSTNFIPTSATGTTSIVPFHYGMSNAPQDYGIKHSASVNWADEQRPLVIRHHHQQSARHYNQYIYRSGGTYDDPSASVPLMSLTNDGDKLAEHPATQQQSSYQETPLGSHGGAQHVSFNIDPPGNEDRIVDFEAAQFTKKRRERSQFSLCFRIFFFLFRLLRLDIHMYRYRVVSDYVDAFKRDNVVIVLCGLLYLYFVCLSPALTFGALLGDLVSPQFSVQSVLACNGCLLILFSILSGNPMIIIGITGPMFLMETVIGKIAGSFGIDIMLYRCLISFYLAGLGIIALACNITWIMQKVRRSVEECFNAFIGLYFIFKAILTILKIFFIQSPVLPVNNETIPSILYPSNATNFTEQMFTDYNHKQYLYDNRLAIGFASLVMAYLMFQICVALNNVKRGRFFTRKFRKMVDYFNVAIGILVLSMLNWVLIQSIGVMLPTLKADVSDSSWIRMPQLTHLINISLLPNIVAATLAVALLSLSFTETAIAGITVTKAERKLVKPSLFAQDQFVCLCILPLICGNLGWPFVCGAAVRSTSFVMSMTKWDSKVVPGVRHKIIGVVEQRVTTMIVGIFVLATVGIESVLRFVPVSAMLGMFLYMGVGAIRDLVVTRRLISMFKRCKHWKDHEYLKDIPPNVLRTFECMQLFMIASMFTMNLLSEFLGVSWTTFLIPVILAVYAVARESILPRIRFLAPHLEKVDPRHLIHTALLCPRPGYSSWNGEKLKKSSTSSMGGNVVAGPVSMIPITKKNSSLIPTDKYPHFKTPDAILIPVTSSIVSHPTINSAESEVDAAHGASSKKLSFTSAPHNDNETVRSRHHKRKSSTSISSSSSSGSSASSPSSSSRSSQYKNNNNESGPKPTAPINIIVGSNNLQRTGYEDNLSVRSSSSSSSSSNTSSPSTSRPDSPNI